MREDGELKKLARSLLKTRPHSWHTPGHKGHLDEYDLTELNFGADFPSKALSKAETAVASAYSAKALRFLTGGASIGVKAAILAADGDIIAPANCHESVIEGAQLNKVKLFRIPNERKNDLDMPLKPEALVRAAKDYRSAKAAVVTSPDYFGQTAPLEIVAAAKEAGLKLIADSAHGAHFPFSGRFPEGFSGTADICVLSAHKTMHALTQTAYACVNDLTLLARFDRALKLLGTTSPSYPLLYSLEEAAAFAADSGQRYEELFAAVNELKEEIPTLDNADFSRIVVDAKRMGQSGYSLYKKLNGRGEVAEIYTDRYVVFIVTADDTADDVLRLKTELIGCKAN